MFLLDRARLETIVNTGSTTRELMLRKASVRLTGARAARDAGDFEGAFVASYDSYRISAEAILAEQGHRAVSGMGSHTTVEDAIAAQFADEYKRIRNRPSRDFEEPATLCSTSTRRRRISMSQTPSGPSTRPSKRENPPHNYSAPGSSPSSIGRDCDLDHRTRYHGLMEGAVAVREPIRWTERDLHFSAQSLLDAHQGTKHVCTVRRTKD